MGVVDGNPIEVAPPKLRYFAWDLRTNARLGELPLRDVSFGQGLNMAGAFTATLPLNVRYDRGDGVKLPYGPTLLARCIPRRTLVTIESNGVLLGAAIIWDRDLSSDRGAYAELAGAELFSMYEANTLDDDFDYTGSPTDQLAVVQDMANWLASVAGGDIGIIVGGETSGVLIEPSWKATDGKRIGEAIRELAETDTGFDFRIVVGRSGPDAAPTKTLQLGYPFIGRRAADTRITFTRGRNGNVRKYRCSQEGTQAITSVRVYGKGDGALAASATASASELIDAGYPRTSDVVAAKLQTDPAVLEAIAINEVAARAMPEFWTVEVDPFPRSKSNQLGTWMVGDEITLVIVDDHNFPRRADGTEGFRQTFRITNQQINDPGRGKRPTVSLELGGTI